VQASIPNEYKKRDQGRESEGYAFVYTRTCAGQYWNYFKTEFQFPLCRGWEHELGRIWLSEFESLVDSRNDSSKLIKTLNVHYSYDLRLRKRGFSTGRPDDNGTRLTVENVSDRMFISVNGPPVEDFGPRPYVKVWLRDRARSAVSAPRGKQRKETDEGKGKFRKPLFVNLFK